jgi:GT2 family glycosyltransferase
LSTAHEAKVWRGNRVPDEPAVSVCIPVVSEHGLIDGCLDSLNGSNPSLETEFVVVANGLDEGGVSSLRSREDIVLVHSAVNTGFSGGNNLAARFARGRFLLLLNDDSVVEDGYIDRLVAALERDPSVAAAGGRILSIDGTVQEAGSVLWRDGWVAHAGSGLPGGSTAYAYPRYADYLSANGLLVDRQAWDAVGGFDERYFPAYYEDVDLCLALQNRGYRVVYEPRAQLTHLESQSTTTTYRGFLLIRNRNQLVAKWSDLLRDYADHPDPIDDAAIDLAVLRAERTAGRVLVIEDTADATEWRGLDMVETLAAGNWSVMVSVPVGRGEASADRAIRDRLVDLGVDVRQERPERLAAEYGSTLEAAVVPGTELGDRQSLWRPDGTEIPMLRRGDERDTSIVRRVEEVARQDGPMTVLGDDEPATQPGGSGLQTPREPDVVHDLPYAEADRQVQREYREYLENELSRTRAALDKTDVHLRQTVDDLERVGESLDARERYIDSLPSVRFKKWLVSRTARKSS